MPGKTDKSAQARSVDSKAFSRLTEPYRRELIAYCYRLTGALTDSEDLVQEALVRAFRAFDGFEGRASLRAWLYRIAHNLCVSHVQRRPPAWASLDELSPQAADERSGVEREDVRLGFVALVQSLPPRQRAALVLRDVLGWSAEESARILDTTVPAVKNALARARQTLAALPQGAGPETVRDLAAADPGAQALVAEWVDAFEKGNTVKMVLLLTGDGGDAAGRRMAGQSGYNHSKNGTKEERTEREVRTDGKRESAGRKSTRSKRARFRQRTDSGDEPVRADDPR